MTEAEQFSEGESELIVTKTGEPPLSPREEEEFRQDCETIVNELGAFVRVGQALRRIKVKRYYRVDYGSFEECVKELFDLAARRAQQLMQTSQVMELLDSEIKQNAKNFSHFAKGILPKNEAQAAALLRAPEEKRAGIWVMAVEKAAGNKVTARHITNTIREEIGGAMEKERKIAKHEPSKDKKERCKPFNDAFNAFWKQINEAYLDDWKKVQKKDVIKRLEGILDYIRNH